MADNPSISSDRVEQLERELAAANERTETLEARLNMFETMAETVPVGIVIANSQGLIVHGNAEVERMVRHPVLHSKDVDEYGEWISYHPDGRKVEAREYPLARVIAEGADHVEMDVHYQRGDGTRFWMRIIGEPVLDQHGERIGAIVALVDIDAEVELQRRQELLIGELNHRVKNAFTVSQAIVSRILRSRGGDEDLIENIDTRLKAYAGAHAKLIGSDWTRVPMMEVAKDVLGHIDEDRIIISGPPVILPPRNALSLSMALYELATNAHKHGSLSRPDGTVELTWQEVNSGEDTRYRVEWKERGGPAPQYSGAKGFGSFITGRALALEMGGEVDLAFPEEGFEWTLIMPKPNLDL